MTDAIFKKWKRNQVSHRLWHELSRAAKIMMLAEIAFWPIHSFISLLSFCTFLNPETTMMRDCKTNCLLLLLAHSRLHTSQDCFVFGTQLPFSWTNSRTQNVKTGAVEISIFRARSRRRSPEENWEVWSRKKHGQKSNGNVAFSPYRPWKVWPGVRIYDLWKMKPASE